MSFIVSPANQITNIPVPAKQGGTGLVASGALDNVLTSNGTTWVSSPAQVGAQGFVTQSTGANVPPGSYNPNDSFAII